MFQLTGASNALKVDVTTILFENVILLLLLLLDKANFITFLIYIYICPIVLQFYNKYISLMTKSQNTAFHYPEQGKLKAMSYFL